MLDEINATAAPYITSLNIQGLQGRMLVHPTRNKRFNKEILVVYGVHASLERNWGVVRFLARYGTVTMPDLPGFGGMKPFSAIGLEASIDNYADYLAAFIKLQYRRKKIVLAGISFGFVVVTRMLQRYPELRNKVELLVSIVGITDRNNFSFGIGLRSVFEALFVVCRTPGVGWVLNHIILGKTFFRLAYHNHKKMTELDSSARAAMIDMEALLWRCNDIRTYGSVMHQLFTLRQPNIRVPMEVHHIGVAADQWLDDTRVQAKMAEQFLTVTPHKTPMKNHGATLIGDESEAASLVPESIIKLLRKKT
jgi:pimeloyl-ACP methyl ester carboxylesterase